MRNWPTDKPAPAVNCQFFEQAFYRERYPYATCQSSATQDIEDTIPALHVCDDHYNTYMVNREGRLLAVRKAAGDE